VHGILVQLPLPEGVDSHMVLKAISVEKDADGFHPLNVGNMWISGGDPPKAVACTPAGCAELLQR
jgi:5,10-methylene-tetrahydrofolate dehydrogenase/methenyl tetrahydrofolate cyclohydrolase